MAAQWGPQDFKAARVRAGLSQASLARALGISQKRLSRHETGERPLSSVLSMRAIEAILAAQHHTQEV